MNELLKAKSALERLQRGQGGVARWDYLIRNLPNTGFVPTSVTIMGVTIGQPFYYVYEAFEGQEQLIIRKQSGGYYRFGSCFGFFGISYLKDIPREITLCEGVVDWYVLRGLGYTTLACLTSGVSTYQRYLLRHLTKVLNLAFDVDKVGNRIDPRLTSIFEVRLLKPPVKDFGAILEDEYLMKLYLREN